MQTGGILVRSLKASRKSRLKANRSLETQSQIKDTAMETPEEESKPPESTAAFAHPDRQRIRKACSSAARSAPRSFCPRRAPRRQPCIQSAPGFKLTGQAPAKPTDDDLLFFNQIGAKYVSVGSTPDLRTAEGFMEIKSRYADAGITVWNIGNSSVHNMPEVVSQPSRPRPEDRRVQAISSQSR